mmetsp:Transcript_30817/g.48287  ORF Transcript_30817/g.48287 Transcript_30817/m.48287 type:complete len:219 (+) Transcript_30817:2348-3004(+)
MLIPCSLLAPTVPASSCKPPLFCYRLLLHRIRPARFHLLARLGSVGSHPVNLVEWGVPLIARIPLPSETALEELLVGLPGPRILAFCRSMVFCRLVATWPAFALSMSTLASIREAESRVCAGPADCVLGSFLDATVDSSKAMALNLYWYTIAEWFRTSPIRNSLPIPKLMMSPSFSFSCLTLRLLTKVPFPDLFASQLHIKSHCSFLPLRTIASSLTI